MCVGLCSDGYDRLGYDKEGFNRWGRMACSPSKCQGSLRNNKNMMEPSLLTSVNRALCAAPVAQVHMLDSALVHHASSKQGAVPGNDCS
jgi:hypothetical protein